MELRGKRVLFIRFVYVLLDVFFIGLAILTACWIRNHTLPFDTTPHKLFFDTRNPFEVVFIFWIATVLFFSNSHGLYQTRREISESVEVWNVLKSVSFSAVTVIVFIYLLKIENFPRSILALGTLFSWMLLSVWRVFKRIFVNFLVSHGYKNFNVLIVGAGKVGIALAEEIKKHPPYGLRIIGFLDDFKGNDRDYAGGTILGQLSDFEEVVRQGFVNKVFITIHHDSKVFLKMLEKARELNVAVRVIPQGFELSTCEFAKYNIGFIPILEYSNEEKLIRQAGKRFFDLVSSLVLTILLLPVFFMIGLWIKFDSPGSVFYLCRRYGRKGKIFYMIKFRSMYADAHLKQKELTEQSEVDGPIFKIRNDPRVTKVGQFLRKYSLDELPQVINVLKGEMSLVGPRPLPIDQIEKEDFRQLKRLAVRPGITGLWQIRGRSDISFFRLLRWDIWYINNWSFWLDVNILFQTIPVVVKGRGAY